MKIETKSFRIEGMSCASCVKRVESALSEQDGVQEVSVNLASEVATVRYQSDKVNPEALQKKIARLGYRLVSKEAKPSSQTFWLAQKDLLIVVAASLLTLPLLLPMILSPFGLHWELSPLKQLMLATPVQFVLGQKFYRQAWRALRLRSLNMDVLVSVGTSAAFGLSVYLGFFTSEAHPPHLYFESAAVIITLVLLGKYLEQRAKKKTTESLRALESLRSETATLIKNGEISTVPIFKVIKGNHLLLRPGERVPVDGIILDGETTVDESLVTGESLPLVKSKGDRLISGSLNIDGQITLEAESIEAESMLAQIIELMESAHQKRAPIEKLVDQVSELFVPLVIVIAFITLGGWKWVGASWEIALINAIAVLVIACPCALGLATPTALMVGRGLAARRGILIKDAEALEKAELIRAVIFDKTGTLTRGEPELVDTERAPNGPFSEGELLQRAFNLQNGNSHPLAKAITRAATARGLTPSPVTAVRLIPGKGIEGQLPSGEVLQIGSYLWMKELGYDTSPLEERYRLTLQKNLSTAWIGNANTQSILGYHSYADLVRPEALSAIQALKTMGLSVVLLSGDKHEVATSVAKQLEITKVIAEVLPDQKLNHLLALRAELGPVAMVGDGINDAPALAAADLGIAMGGGTDAAIGAAAITLLKNSPQQVVEAIHVAQLTYRKIKQNLFWAFIYNVIGIPLASFGLLNPMWAAAAMAFSSVSVVSNSLILGSRK